ncbi:MAG: PorT family protein [Prevotellaceae bacterium]|jgi:hypothetical protein|nr:PorT family protein [Prevotellaceae bacterium]
MKKLVVFFAAALGVSAATFGQVKFGVKAGLNVSSVSAIESNLSQPSMESGDWATGLLAGAYASYAFSEAVGVQAELVFSQQGGGLMVPAADSSGLRNSLFRQTYLNLPLMVSVAPVKKLPLEILAGLQVGMRLKKTVDGEENTVNGNDYVDLSAVLGAQYTLIKHLTFGLRYNIGLIPSFHHYNDVSFPGTTWTNIGARHRVLQLSVGWTF